MPNIYVRSTDGSDSDNGSTWALAKATLVGAAGIDAAGDTIYVSHNHNETTSAANVNPSWAGTAAAPVRVICVNDGAEPPTTLATTATVNLTNGSFHYITLNSGAVYYYGINFIASGSASYFGINAGASGGNPVVFDNCTFEVGSDTYARGFVLAKSIAIDCTFRFGAEGVKKIILDEGSRIYGGQMHASSGFSTVLFTATSNSVDSIVDGFDMTNCPTTINLVEYTAGRGGGFLFRNCKLPSSWTGSLAEGTMYAVPNWFVKLENCDSGDTNYKFWWDSYYGSIRDDTGVYNDAGATNGTTRMSFKMVSSANVSFNNIDLWSPEIVKWNDTTGSQITVTVEIVHNSQGGGTNGALKDDEIWLEVFYLGNSGNPLGERITTRRTIMGTAADVATSSATWTGDSAGWDTQKLSVSFTPQEKGYIHAVVHLSKPSATVYIDPLLTVT